MPQDLKCDPLTGDLVVGSNGDLELLADDESALQDLRVRLRMIEGESLFFPLDGLNPVLISSGLPIDLVAGAIATQAEGVAGITDVTCEATTETIPEDRIGEFRISGVYRDDLRNEQLRFEQITTIELA